MPDQQQTEKPSDYASVRQELRRILNSYVLTSRSERIRVETSDLISAAYSNGYLSRPEFHAAMGGL